DRPRNVPNDRPRHRHRTVPARARAGIESAVEPGLAVARIPRAALAREAPLFQFPKRSSENAGTCPRGLSARRRQYAARQRPGHPRPEAAPDREVRTRQAGMLLEVLRGTPTRTGLCRLSGRPAAIPDGISSRCAVSRALAVSRRLSLRHAP